MALPATQAVAGCQCPRRVGTQADSEVPAAAAAWRPRSPKLPPRRRRMHSDCHRLAAGDSDRGSGSRLSLSHRHAGCASGGETSIQRPRPPATCDCDRHGDHQRALSGWAGGPARPPASCQPEWRYRVRVMRTARAAAEVTRRGPGPGRRRLPAVTGTGGATGTGRGSGAAPGRRDSLPPPPTQTREAAHWHSHGGRPAAARASDTVTVAMFSG